MRIRPHKGKRWMDQRVHHLVDSSGCVRHYQLMDNVPAHHGGDVDFQPGIPLNVHRPQPGIAIGDETKQQAAQAGFIPTHNQ